MTPLVPPALRRAVAFRSAAGKRHSRSSASKGRTARLLVEKLEDRTTPALFTVTTTDDSGAGSFREALTNAVDSPDDDVIDFDTAGIFADPQTITLESELPLIDNGALTIIGTGTGNL